MSTPINHNPTLRIHHLLVWTAVTAVFFSIFRTGSGSAYWSGLGIILILSGSAGITFLGFATRWVYRGNFLFTPGQGFLLFAAVWLAMRTADSIMMHHWSGYDTILTENPPFHSARSLWNRAELFLKSLSALTCCLVFLDVFRWRIVYFIFFAGQAAALRIFLLDYSHGSGFGDASELVLTSLEILQLASYPTMLLALFWAILLDRRLGIKRDWTHWSGIAFGCCLLIPFTISATRRLILDL